MNIGEATCKNIINRSGIEGVDYAVNPYIGCTHGCVYCYARFMTRWYHKGEKWGSFVDVKKNAKQCLIREAGRKRLGTILFSSVTDPYQPAEKQTQITRELLKTLTEHSYPVQILTKSSLVTRDIDVIGELHRCEVGLTITGINEDMRRVFEPGASPITERLDALKQYTDVGVGTYAFLGPLLPYVSEENLEMLMNQLADKAGRVIVDRLNIKAGNWGNIEQAVVKHYPDLLGDFKEASKDESAYYTELKKKVERMLRKRAIPYDFVY